MTDYPCYKCEHRKTGCHSRCAKYLQAVAEQNRLSALDRELRARESEDKTHEYIGKYCK